MSTIFSFTVRNFIIKMIEEQIKESQQKDSAQQPWLKSIWSRNTELSIKKRAYLNGLKDDILSIDEDTDDVIKEK